MCGNCAGVASAYSINVQHKFLCVSVDVGMGVYERERATERQNERERGFS